MLGVETLEGKSILDAGSGSGLFSLAARRLGARVHSFDVDPDCVACTAELRKRYCGQDHEWRIEQGSVLDIDYLRSLGQFDIVYSWGVLHHTGHMWTALDNVMPLVADGGLLFVAIYNDQGRRSRRWLLIKKTYNRLPPVLRFLVLMPAFVRLWGPTMLRDALRGRPFSSWRQYGETGRGMSPWHDVIDWVGGYPFEVAKPDVIIEHCRERGLVLVRAETCGTGMGCNEFVFRKGRALRR